MKLNALTCDVTHQLTYLTAAILFLCHGWQFVDSGYQTEPLIRVALCVIYLAGAPLHKDFIYYYFAIFAYIILYFNKFQNYTSFFILTIIVYKSPKHKKLIYSLYALDVVLALLINHRSASHCLIHVLNCIFIYYGFNYVVLKKAPALDLTMEEEIILKELANGAQQKSIPGFSKNTITKKLTEARERNNCLSTAELVYKYKNQ